MNFVDTIHIISTICQFFYGHPGNNRKINTLCRTLLKRQWRNIQRSHSPHRNLELAINRARRTHRDELVVQTVYPIEDTNSVGENLELWRGRFSLILTNQPIGSIASQLAGQVDGQIDTHTYRQTDKQTDIDRQIRMRSLFNI